MPVTLKRFLALLFVLTFGMFLLIAETEVDSRHLGTQGSMCKNRFCKEVLLFFDREKRKRIKNTSSIATVENDKNSAAKVDFLVGSVGLEPTTKTL